MKKIYEYDDDLTAGVDSNIPVRIISGAYKGTVYTYGHVSFEEVDDNVNCKFEYNIIEKPDNIKEDEIFVNQLGEILVDILVEEIEEVEEDFLRSGIPLSDEDSWTCNFRKLIV